MSHSRAARSAVVVLGDITVDVMAPVAAFPDPGEDCLSPRLELRCGGVGANTAMALARWGIAARLVGSVGRDAFGDLALDLLRRQGVDVSCVQRTGRALTGLMYIIVGADGQRTIFGGRGASAVIAPVQARCLAGAGALHLMGYNFLSASVANAATQLLREARRRGAVVSLDVGMAPSREIPGKILQVARKVDILFVGLGEAVALTNRRGASSAFEALESRGAREVVMKLGPEGCLFREDGALRNAPGFRVKVADTTGAGDAFAAALLRARLRGWSRAESALLANAAGAAAVTVVGAGEFLPGPPQVLRLLRSSRLRAEWGSTRRQVLKRLRAEGRDSRGGPR